MKRFLPAMIALILFAMAGCKPSPQKLADKVGSGEPLTQEEYTEAMNYTQSVLDIIMDSIEAHDGDFRGMMESLKYLKATYPESDIIAMHLQTMDPSTLDEANREQYEKLMAGIEKMGAAMSQNGPTMRVSDLGQPQKVVNSKDEADGPKAGEGASLKEAPDSVSVVKAGAETVIRELR